MRSDAGSDYDTIDIKERQETKREITQLLLEKDNLLEQISFNANTLLFV